MFGFNKLQQKKIIIVKFCIVSMTDNSRSSPVHHSNNNADCSGISPHDIQFVYFDWGGTFGKSGKRKDLILSSAAKDPVQAGKEAMYADSLRYIPMISDLMRQRNGGIGILSNTKWSGNQCDQGLKYIGLKQYFSPRIYSSDIGIKKPDPEIFRLGLHKLVSRGTTTNNNINNQNILYIGNSPEKDVIAAKNAGWKVGFIRRSKTCHEWEMLSKGTCGPPDVIFSDLSHLYRWLLDGTVLRTTCLLPDIGMPDIGMPDTGNANDEFQQDCHHERYGGVMTQ